MLKRSVSLVGVLSAICVGPLSAQDAVKTDSLTGWSVSVGFDPMAHTYRSRFSENFTGAVARDWARKNSGLGFRTQLAVGTTPTSNTILRGCTGCIVHLRRSFAELSTTATYTFRRTRNFKPYVLAGPALYGVRSAYGISGAVLGNPDDNSSLVWSLGATAGAGLGFTIFGTKMFLEQRIFVPEASTSRGSLVVRPFTLGIRF
jgi:opacity protein-like surface antigen